MRLRVGSLKGLLLTSRIGLYDPTRKVTTTSSRWNKNAEGGDWRKDLQESMRVLPDFVTAEEETILMEEIEPYVKRLRYEYSHWDDAIHGFRESEKREWNEENTKILNRVRGKAFAPGMAQIAHIHVLDLAKEGWIKPHVDSVRFCGDIIAGLSLLTDSVMRLRMVDREEECFEDFLLPRRSLYVMSGRARYNYKHEILKNEESYFNGKRVEKDRRISVICRCEPDPRKGELT